MSATPMSATSLPQNASSPPSQQNAFVETETPWFWGNRMPLEQQQFLVVLQDGLAMMEQRLLALMEQRLQAERLHNQQSTMLLQAWRQDFEQRLERLERLVSSTCEIFI